MAEDKNPAGNVPADPLARSSYAIPHAQKAELELAIKQLGLPSLAQLLGMIADRRSTLVPMLLPHAEAHMLALDAQREEEKRARRIARLQEELRRETGVA